MKSRNLDLLRAIAVLCVFAAHLLGSTGVWTIGSLGRFGVIIFFVHTSLVLMFSLERLQHDGFGSGWRLAAAFWIRRAFRIYPLSSVFIVLAVLGGIPQELGQPYVWMRMPVVLSNLALSQNLFYHPDVVGILWSLPLEVQMYVLLPFAFLLIQPREKYVAVGLWLLSVVVALTLTRITLRLNVLTFAPCFTAGIVAFAMGRSGERPIPGWVWLPGVLLLILLFGPFDNVPLSDKMGKAWLLTLALGVLAAHTREHNWHRLNAVAHWIAEQSYGIYLSHIPVLWLVIYIMADWPFLVRAVVLVVASAGIPALCYRYIEKPLIRYGATVAQRVRPIEPVMAAEQAVT